MAIEERRSESHAAPFGSPFSKRFDRLTKTFVGVAAASAVLGASLTLYAVWPPNQSVGYEPDQPFVFSHAAMAGNAQIPCLYCHYGAETGAYAGIPPVSLCMNCHSQLEPTDEQGRVRANFAAFVEQYIDPKTKRPLRSIVWQKVHDLSDFAYFDHSRHTVGGRLDCSECHGPVEEMTRVRRVYSLKMQWCLECHRKPPESWRTDGRETRGPTACSTCHR